MRISFTTRTVCRCFAFIGYLFAVFSSSSSSWYFCSTSFDRVYFLINERKMYTKIVNIHSAIEHNKVDLYVAVWDHMVHNMWSPCSLYSNALCSHIRWDSNKNAFFFFFFFSTSLFTMIYDSLPKIFTNGIPQ